MTDGTVADGPTRDEVRAAAVAFIGSAFASLTEENVLPTPRVHPYIEVGRDYFGGDIMPLAEFSLFSSVLERAYRARFAEPVGSTDPEFANAYVFSFLEACVARCGIEGYPYEPNSPPVEERITELIAVLEQGEFQIACCREISHLTTADEEPLQIGDVLLVPESADRHSLIGVASSEVPGTVSAFNRNEPRFYDPPKSMIIVRERSDDRPYEVASSLIGTIERFLLIARLLHSSTAQSYWQVYGMSTLVSRMNPVYKTFSPASAMGPLVRRTVRLTADDAPAFEELGSMLDGVAAKRDGMATTSFDMALDRYLRSYRTSNGFDAIIDLATALEAVLTGDDSSSEAISLRLRNRAAALLATDVDDAGAIFKDLALLYGVRSKLLHAGGIKENDMKRDIARVSTVPADSPFGMAVAYAVDRMRDLVRRSILARLCLAAAPDPLWPFSGGVSVDAALSDDAFRIRWRETWRGRMDAIGATAAAQRARPGVDFISQEDR